MCRNCDQCTINCCRCVLGALIFIIILLSAALLVISSWYLTRNYTIIDSPFEYICIFSLINSILVLLIAVFGCYGNRMQNQAMLRVFVYMLFIVGFLNIILALIACICAYAWKYTEVENNLRRIFALFYTSQKQKKLVDSLQEDLKCCGLEGPTSWNLTIPESCCVLQPCVKARAFQQDCLRSTIKKIKEYKTNLAAVTATIASATCLSGFFVLQVLRLVRRGQYDNNG